MALKNKIRIIPRKLIVDERGWFLKVITGTEEDIPQHTGEVYLTMGKVGQAKGGHYHPKALEWFTVIQGEAKLILEDTETKERMEILMNLKNPYLFLCHVRLPMFLSIRVTVISFFWLIQISSMIRKIQSLTK